MQKHIVEALKTIIFRLGLQKRAQRSSLRQSRQKHAPGREWRMGLSAGHDSVNKTTHRRKISSDLTRMNFVLRCSGCSNHSPIQSSDEKGGYKTCQT